MNVTFYFDDRVAIDRTTFLPIWKRTHFVRMVKGQIQMDQTCFYRLADLQINREVDEKIFTPENFKLTEEIKAAVINEGYLIPDWKITTVDGKEYSKAGQAGKVYILAFGYVGCGACNMAMPQFKVICEKYKDHAEVKVFYLNGVDGEAYFRKYGKEKGLACELSAISREYTACLGVEGYPHYYVIDRQGRVVKNIGGYSMNDKNKIRLGLEYAVSDAL